MQFTSDWWEGNEGTTELNDCASIYPNLVVCEGVAAPFFVHHFKEVDEAHRHRKGTVAHGQDASSPPLPMTPLMRIPRG